VLDCVNRAQAKIPDLLRQAMTETVGTGDPSSRLVVDEARKRFPEPPPPEGQRSWQPDEMRFSVSENAAIPSPAAPPPPARTPRPRRVAEEIWDDERPILRDV
jgi:hypothetical protein